MTKRVSVSRVSTAPPKRHPEALVERTNPTSTVSLARSKTVSRQCGSSTAVPLRASSVDVHRVQAVRCVRELHPAPLAVGEILDGVAHRRVIVGERLVVDRPLNAEGAASTPLGTTAPRRCRSLWSSSAPSKTNDSHAIKLAEVCVREFSLNPQPVYLTAAQDWATRPHRAKNWSDAELAAAGIVIR